MKDVIQGSAEPLDVIHSKLLKALNISVPGAGPELADIPVPFDGALVKTRGLREIQCDIFPPEETLMPAPPAGVRSTIEQLRGRTDKPPATGGVRTLWPLKIMAFGTQLRSYQLTNIKGCHPITCSDSAGITFCSYQKNSVSLEMIHISLCRHKRSLPIPCSTGPFANMS